MRLSSRQIDKIRSKDANTADALKRDPLADYSEGWFFVTLNTRKGAPPLSTVEGRVGASGADAPHCCYTALGRKVLEAWEKMPTVCSTVEIVACEVMPEHFHGLVHLLPNNKRHLGSLISGFMSGCTHGYWDILGIDWHKDRFDNGAYARVCADRDRDHTRSLRGPALFVRGYNDVEAISPEQVQTKLEYIRSQAERRLIKADNRPCFKVRRHAHSPSWTVQSALHAIAADPGFACDMDNCREVQREVSLRLNADERGLCLDYVGQTALLGCEKKLPLVCHRADAAYFDRQRDAVIRAAREGWVIVSAFISDRERELLDYLLEEHLPVIQIMDNGLSERYKPYGKAFCACAEERLVQISPWTYVYSRGAKVTRARCLVMNQLARVICGRGDGWWK